MAVRSHELLGLGTNQHHSHVCINVEEFGYEGIASVLQIYYKLSRVEIYKFDIICITSPASDNPFI